MGGYYGNPVAVIYNFMVLPTASFTPSPPRSFPAIAGLATWQSNMTNPTPYPGSGETPYRSAEWWCTNDTNTNPWSSLDNGNFTGYFDLPSSIYFEAWNYDGGRVYQQIADYDYTVLGMPGYQNRSHRDHWKRCAELALEPYKDTALATKGGFVQEPNQFPYGMAMNYLRTGDATMQRAVNVLATNPAYNLYPTPSSYAWNARVGLTCLMIVLLQRSQAHLEMHLCHEPLTCCWATWTRPITLASAIRTSRSTMSTRIWSA